MLHFLKKLCGYIATQATDTAIVRDDSGAQKMKTQTSFLT